MTDDNDTIVLKNLKKAKTDSSPMPELGDDLSKRPEIENLINIFSSCSGISKKLL
ncbi:MAG: hypothetical protein Ct9H90mP18_10280 [Gammaproteobacteria bacterium]|nr:MAG: hypothetical protein Ct9H90mP18_10280 [Gammaproteobacteria bacterium]